MAAGRLHRLSGFKMGTKLTNRMRSQRANNHFDEPTCWFASCALRDLTVCLARLRIPPFQGMMPTRQEKEAIEAGVNKQFLDKMDNPGSFARRKPAGILRGSAGQICNRPEGVNWAGALLRLPPGNVVGKASGRMALKVTKNGPRGRSTRNWPNTHQKLRVFLCSTPNCFFPCLESHVSCSKSSAWDPYAGRSCPLVSNGPNFGILKQSNIVRFCHNLVKYCLLRDCTPDLPPNPKPQQRSGPPSKAPSSTSHPPPPLPRPVWGSVRGL